MNQSHYIFLLILLLHGCIERLDYASFNADEGTLVIDGSITNTPGPHTIKLFKVSGSTDILNFSQPVIASRVILSDDAGNSEELSAKGGGVYETEEDGLIGTVGRKYSVRIELQDGTVFESIPDEMRPVKEIDSVYYEWTAVDKLKGPTEYGFDVYLDTNISQDEYVRWRYTGVYEVNTYPELAWWPCSCCERRLEPDPYPCSGVVYSGGILKQEGPCECCSCWISDFEDKPKLGYSHAGRSGNYNRIKLGFVPFDQWTFSHYKYMVRIEQMSLTREAFDYWKVFEDQKNNSTSLFQPALDKAKTNLFSTNSNAQAIGFFYATAVSKNIIFISGADAPLPVPQQDIFPPETNCVLWRPCDAIFPNASRTPPPEWVD